VASKKYVPKAGDIVWLDFDPQSGREQRGHRPAFVISPEEYNRATGLMICCPMTTKIKGYPFEVLVQDAKTPSVILTDQMKSLDWKSRGVRFKAQANGQVLLAAQDRIKALLQID
jgi:mRNA interferase MazF